MMIMCDALDENMINIRVSDIYFVRKTDICVADVTLLCCFKHSSLICFYSPDWELLQRKCLKLIHMVSVCSTFLIISCLLCSFL